VESTSRGAGKQFFGAAAQTARLMLYGLLAVVLMAMDQRGHYVPRIRGMVEYLVEPIYHVVDWPVSVLRSAFGRMQSHRSLRESNEKLRRRLLEQQADLLRLQTLVEENSRLRSLIEGAAGQTFDFQFAELLNVDLDPFVHRVVIDRGAADGVEPGQAILDGAGVMGQVEEVQRYSSTVRLISDPSHGLPVQVNRTGLRTIAYGTGETGHLRLPNVPRQADVREGDLVVTSGLGDRFPSGYPVATVSLIRRQEGETFLQVEATPLAALDRGREVLLIRAVDLPPFETTYPDASVEPATQVRTEAATTEAATADDTSPEAPTTEAPASEAPTSESPSTEDEAP